MAFLEHKRVTRIKDGRKDGQESEVDIPPDFDILSEGKYLLTLKSVRLLRLVCTLKQLLQSNLLMTMRLLIDAVERAPLYPSCKLIEGKFHCSLLLKYSLNEKEEYAWGSNSVLL